jgi:hypothetical protein
MTTHKLIHAFDKKARRLGMSREVLLRLVLEEVILIPDEELIGSLRYRPVEEGAA